MPWYALQEKTDGLRSFFCINTTKTIISTIQSCMGLLLNTVPPACLLPSLRRPPALRTPSTQCSACSPPSRCCTSTSGGHGHKIGGLQAGKQMVPDLQTSQPGCSAPCLNMGQLGRTVCLLPASQPWPHGPPAASGEGRTAAQQRAASWRYRRRRAHQCCAADHSGRSGAGAVEAAC